MNEKTFYFHSQENLALKKNERSFTLSMGKVSFVV